MIPCLQINAKCFSMTIQLQYLENGSYPSYKCCQTNDLDCEYFISNYQIVLYQNAHNTIEPAWKGLSNCNVQPRINLVYDSSIKC